MDLHQHDRVRLFGYQCILLLVEVLALLALFSACRRSRSMNAKDADFVNCVSPATQSSRTDCAGLNVKQVGQGTLVEEEAEQPVLHRRTKGTRQPHEVPVDDARYGSVSMRAFNGSTKIVYEVTLSQALLDRIRKERESRGLNQGSQSVKDPTAIEGAAQGRSQVQKAVWDEETIARMIPIPTAEQRGSARLQLVGRSNGVDTRIIRAPTTIYPWSTIALFSNTCSGTLIGPRLLITAAHCINKRGTTTFYNITVTPGSDGTGVTPYGNSQTLAPGGPTWYWTSTQWQQCDSDDYDDCEEYDWGFLVVPKPLGISTGWMGYEAEPQSVLNSVKHWNRGYPGCASKWGLAVPVNCQPYRLYGDTHSCPLGDYENEDPDGWNRNIEHGCDTSPGQSGSPVYHYGLNQNGQWVPIVTMVNIASRCDDKGLDPCESDDDTPNKARRIGPAALGVINWGLQTFP
jgi:V8-like Glu-specific endopeptidase